MTYVSRDPFAREEIHRRFEVGKECQFCGVQSYLSRKSYPLGGGSYRYRVEMDDGRVSEDTVAFCTLACRRAYYGF